MSMNDGYHSSDYGGGAPQDDYKSEREATPEEAHEGKDVDMIPKTSIVSKEEYEQMQIGYAERRPWSWSDNKSREIYRPIRQGKWWYKTNSVFDAQSTSKQRDWSHISRIMESELGEQLPEDRKCSSCRETTYECWVYSKQGANQIRCPGSTCARCRVVPRKNGCSLSTRVQHKNVATSSSVQS